MHGPIRMIEVLIASSLIAATCGPVTPTSSTAAGRPLAPGGRITVGAFADAKTLSPTLAADLQSLALVPRIYDSPFLSADS